MTREPRPKEAEFRSSVSAITSIGKSEREKIKGRQKDVGDTRPRRDHSFMSTVESLI